MYFIFSDSFAASNSISTMALAFKYMYQKIIILLEKIMKKHL
jgi:hypothetical protein